MVCPQCFNLCWRTGCYQLQILLKYLQFIATFMLIICIVVVLYNQGYIQYLITFSHCSSQIFVYYARRMINVLIILIKSVTYYSQKWCWHMHITDIRLRPCTNIIVTLLNNWNRHTWFLWNYNYFYPQSLCLCVSTLESFNNTLNEPCNNHLSKFSVSLHTVAIPRLVVKW